MYRIVKQHCIQSDFNPIYIIRKLFLSLRHFIIVRLTRLQPLFLSALCRRASTDVDRITCFWNPSQLPYTLDDFALNAVFTLHMEQRIKYASTLLYVVMSIWNATAQFYRQMFIWEHGFFIIVRLLENCFLFILMQHNEIKIYQGE